MRQHTRRQLAYKARLVAKALSSPDLADEVIGPLSRSLEATLTNILLTCHAAMSEAKAEREAAEAALEAHREAIEKAKRHDTLASYLQTLPRDAARSLLAEALGGDSVALGDAARRTE